jgi:CrcB protein
LPWGTIAVNILGSFIIGVIAGLALTLGATAFEPWRIALASGLCGGFTTFSTTTVESVALARRSELKAAIANSLGTLVTCVAATALGVVVVTS